MTCIDDACTLKIPFELTSPIPPPTRLVAHAALSTTTHLSPPLRCSHPNYCTWHRIVLRMDARQATKTKPRALPARYTAGPVIYEDEPSSRTRREKTSNTSTAAAAATDSPHVMRPAARAPLNPYFPRLAPWIHPMAGETTGGKRRKRKQKSCEQETTTNNPSNKTRQFPTNEGPAVGTNKGTEKELEPNIVHAILPGFLFAALGSRVYPTVYMYNPYQHNTRSTSQRRGPAHPRTNKTSLTSPEDRDSRLKPATPNRREKTGLDSSKQGSAKGRLPGPSPRPKKV